jgi:hypothetical protein
LSEPLNLVLPEELGKLGKFTSSGIEPATFWLVASCLNHYATACPHVDINFIQCMATSKSSGTEMDIVILWHTGCNPPADVKM